MDKDLLRTFQKNVKIKLQQEEDVYKLKQKLRPLFRKQFSMDLTHQSFQFSGKEKPKLTDIFKIARKEQKNESNILNLSKMDTNCSFALSTKQDSGAPSKVQSRSTSPFQTVSQKARSITPLSFQKPPSYEVLNNSQLQNILSCKVIQDDDAKVKQQFLSFLHDKRQLQKQSKKSQISIDLRQKQNTNDSLQSNNQEKTSVFLFLQSALSNKLISKISPQVALKNLKKIEQRDKNVKQLLVFQKQFNQAQISVKYAKGLRIEAFRQLSYLQLKQHSENSTFAQINNILIEVKKQRVLQQQNHEIIKNEISEFQNLKCNLQKVIQPNKFQEVDLNYDLKGSELYTLKLKMQQRVYYTIKRLLNYDWLISIKTDMCYQTLFIDLLNMSINQTLQFQMKSDILDKVCKADQKIFKEQVKKRIVPFIKLLYLKTDKQDQLQLMIEDLKKKEPPSENLNIPSQQYYFIQAEIEGLGFI